MEAHLKGRFRPANPPLGGVSQQVQAVLLQPVASLAGQREGAVLVVWDARVPERAAVLLEVRLVGDGAGPVHGGTGAPAARTVSGTFKKGANNYITMNVLNK